MKVYITKYALTRGIIQVNGDWNAERYPDLVSVTDFPASDRLTARHFCRPDWHASLEEAKERVREMFQKERKELEARLECLDEIEENVLQGPTES
jgi:hypothetical protein